MATSNSFDYSATALSVITEALEQIDVLHVGETLSADDLTSSMRTLNFMVKQWSSNFDFAPGLKAFSRKHGYIFLQKNQGTYTLGPTGDNASLSYVTTTMRAAGVATNTTLEVTSTTGMTAADKIGIVLDTGYVHWTTISSITDADTLVIPATGLPSGVAIGKQIFTYTTKLIRPLQIEKASMLSTNGTETQMEQMTTAYYENISVKSTDSFPTYYKYDNTLTNGTYYIDVEPNDVTYVIRLTFTATAEDYDTQSNDIAYPQEWFMALSLGLAKLTAPKFGQKWGADQESNFMNAVSMARSSYAETSELYFQPGLE